MLVGPVKNSFVKFALLLNEHRYRAQYLRADAEVNTKIIAIFAIAMMVLLRNDIMLVRDRTVLGILVATRTIGVVVALIGIVVLRQSQRTRQHDRTYWIVVMTLAISMGIIVLTRIPLGEVQGPTFGVLAFVGILGFGLRGSIWPRMLGSAIASASLFVLLFNSPNGMSLAARTTLTLAVGILTAIGFISSRAFEEQRRKRFAAERQERKVLRRLEAKMAELAIEKKHAETMVRARTAFLATMSHEFRTPMNAVLGFSELLLDKRLDAQSHEYAKLIRESARGLLSLLDDVLDFAKIDADKLVLSAAPFDLKTLLASVVAMMEPLVASRPVVIELQSSPDVPQFVRGDELRLRQVLVNLLSNAAKFTERGHLRLIVKSRPRNDKHHELDFSIEDTGIGMSEAVKSRLFQPFEQGEQGMTRRHQGTGLGLVITKRIVQAMGGDIHVESQVGQGSTFSFSISLVEADPVSSQRLRHAEDSSIPLSILLVDDHVINRRLATAMLDRLGYQADLAEDGPTAISAAAKKKYDVIFMDLHLPGMSGIDATAQILASSGKEAPTVIAMTASIFEEDREACRQVGMRGFVSKPIDLAQLDAALRKSAKHKSASNAAHTPADLRMNDLASEVTGDKLDASVIAQLRELEQIAEPGFVADLIRSFLGDVPQRFERLRKGIETLDAKLLAFEAHTLKSTCNAMGATGMANWCVRIEKAAHENELADIPEWLDALEAEFRRVEPLLALETMKHP